MKDKGQVALVVVVAALAWSCTKFQTAATADGGDGAMGGSGGAGASGGGGGSGGAAGGGPGDGAAGSDAAVDAGPVCGNAVKEGAEQCDDGAALNIGGYGKCNANCTLGPHCGDSAINGPDEACDDGPNNGLGLNQCNPVCSGTVKQKSIKIFNLFGEGGNLTNDWDPFCMTQFGTTYKALIVDGVTRVASTTAFKGDGQVDWVLKPYTRYVNANGELLWTTDAVNLLGVRNGAAAALLASFGGGGSDFAWAGFESNWTTSSLNCGRWNVSSGGGGTVLALGVSGVSIMVTVGDCAGSNFVLCAEQ